MEQNKLNKNKYNNFNKYNNKYNKHNLYNKKQNNIDNRELKKEKKEDIELGLYLIKNIFEKNIEKDQTKFIISSIRSGNKIMYEGSIIIIGDVNAGAEIIAGGNIIVLGDLRGMAHAGAMGNIKAIIAANNLESPQLRIANILWENEESINYLKKYAVVENDKINLIDF